MTETTAAEAANAVRGSLSVAVLVFIGLPSFRDGCGSVKRRSPPANGFDVFGYTT